MALMKERQMRKAGAYPRLSYAIVVIVSAVVASILIVDIAAGLATANSFARLLSSNAYLLAFLLALLFPSIGAVVRLFRRLPLLSASEVDQRKYVLFITILGSLGHFCAFNVAVAYFQIVVEGRDSSGAGFLVGVTGLCYLTALWIGEFVIMRFTSRVTTEPTDAASRV